MWLIILLALIQPVVIYPSEAVHATTPCQIFKYSCLYSKCMAG